MTKLSAAHDKRRRRARGEVEQFEQQILAELEQDYPQSIRHLFHCMTVPRQPEPVERSDRGYRHVQRRVTELRRCGRVPDGWISDATRCGFHTSTFTGPAEFERRMLRAESADERRAALADWEAPIKPRSPQQVERMDKARGLR